MSGFLEKVEEGMVLDLGSHTFGRAEIIAFAEQFDPQRFHLDEDAAKASLFGALCASGWHVVSIWMRLNVEHRTSELARLTGLPESAIVFGPSPGVRNLRWRRPVYPGDTIRFTSTVTGKRITPKRPGWGMVMSQITGVNQTDTTVCTMDGAVTVRL